MRKYRVIAIFFVFLLLAGFMYALHLASSTGGTLGCIFRKTTGLECPGCGMTRAMHAVLAGRFVEAFHLNPVGMIVYPGFVILLLIEAVAWAMDHSSFLRLRVLHWIIFAFVGALLVWWVVRNLI